MSSIGVIGGADGPTRVFVSGPVWPVGGLRRGGGGAGRIPDRPEKEMNRAVHLCGRCRAMEAVISEADENSAK